MDNLLYVTKIIDNDTGEELYVFIDKRTYHKYISKEKDKYVPYDENFENKLNSNISSLLKVPDNYIKNIQDVIKIALVSSGIGLTIIGSFVVANEQLILTRQCEFKQALSINYNEFDSIISEFNRIVDLNSDFTEQEKELLKKGTNNFLEDWGYLFSEQDIKDLLFRIGNVRVRNKNKMEYNVSGTYYNLHVDVINRQDILTSIHEYIHCMMDHKKVNGFRNNNGLGRAIDEAIVETLTSYYYASTSDDVDRGSYVEQRKNLFKISLFIDSESLLKRSFVSDESIIDIFKNSCPGVEEDKILRYLTLLDIDCAGIFEEKYSQDDDFYREIDSLYNELYKAKYGKDFNYSYEIISDNFLSDDVVFIDGNCTYCIPKAIFHMIDKYALNDNDYKKYLCGIHYKYFDLFAKMPIIVFAGDDDEAKYIESNTDEFLLGLYEKYENDPEKQNDIINILNLTENCFDSYFNIYIDLLKERNLHPAVFIAELRKGLSLFEQYCLLTESQIDSDIYYKNSIYKNKIDKIYGEMPSEFTIRSRLHEKWVKELGKKIDCLHDFDLSYWYNETDVNFIYYDLYDKEECILSDVVYEEKRIEKVLFIGSNKVVVPIEEGSFLKTDSAMEYDLLTDENTLELCDNYFKNENYKYCVITIPIDYIDELNLMSSLSIKSLEFKQIQYIEIPNEIVKPYMKANSKVK